MSYLVTDIETVPDLDLWSPDEARAEWLKKHPGETEMKDPVAPPQAQRPIVIGCLWFGDDLSVKKIGAVGQGRLHNNEHQLLSTWAGFMSREVPCLVTWNGRSFDVPCLILRAFRHGISLPWYFADKNYRYRYSDKRHMDLMDTMGEYGAVNRAGFKLDMFARAIGLPGKYGVDGSMVDGMYKDGKISDIETYCLTDVLQTAFVLLRWLLVKGNFSVDDYRKTANKVIDACGAEKRFDEFVSLIDRKTLLLSDIDSTEAQPAAPSRNGSSSRAQAANP